MRVIETAYDAWWFLYEHPEFNINERVKCNGPKPVTKKTKFMKKMESNPFYVEPKIVKAKTTDGEDVWYSEHSSTKHALDDLWVFYARVDETGTINDDKSKNVNTEVWLEFGPIYWQNEFNKKYRKNPGDEKTYVDYPESFISVSHMHDGKLDVGAATFDEALVKLANKVIEHYGDYEEK